MNIAGYLALCLLFIPMLAAAGAVVGLVALLVLCQFIDAQKIPFAGIIWTCASIGFCLGVALNVFIFRHREELEQAIQRERDKPIILYSEEEHQPPKGGNTHATQEAVRQ